MYGRGFPCQSPRFSPQRRNENYQRSPYNNNNANPHCGGYQQDNSNIGYYRTPSPRGPRTHNPSSYSPFQVPLSPRDSPFVNPSLRLQFQQSGNANGFYRAPSPRGNGGFGQPTRSPRQFSPRQNLSPYYTSSRGHRGNFSHGKTSTPNYRGKPGGRFDKRESNPGANSDIKMYCNARMLEDPWKNMTPLPFKHAPSAT